MWINNSDHLKMLNFYRRFRFIILIFGLMMLVLGCKSSNSLVVTSESSTKIVHDYSSDYVHPIGKQLCESIKTIADLADKKTLHLLEKEKIHPWLRQGPPQNGINLNLPGLISEPFISVGSSYRSAFLPLMNVSPYNDPIRNQIHIIKVHQCLGNKVRGTADYLFTESNAQVSISYKENGDYNEFGFIISEAPKLDPREKFIGLNKDAAIPKKNTTPEKTQTISNEIRENTGSKPIFHDRTKEHLEKQRRKQEEADAWVRDRKKYQKERAEKNAKSNSNRGVSSCWRIENMPAPAFRQYKSWASGEKCVRIMSGSRTVGGGWDCSNSAPSNYPSCGTNW